MRIRLFRSELPISRTILCDNMHMRLTYANTKEEDAEKILQMERELIDAYEDFSKLSQGKVYAFTRQKIAAELPTYTTIYCDGHKAGWYHFTDEGNYMELDDLFILPHYQEKGIGSAVIERCIHAANKPVRAYVFTGNIGAVGLFEKLDFQIIQTLHHTRYVMEHHKEIEEDEEVGDLFDQILGE